MQGNRWRIPTFGGKQVWGDEFVYGGLRIQQNVFTGHHRLLDDRDARLAFGSWTQCYRAFERIRDARGLQPDSDHLVLLLHGIFRSKDSFGPMTAALRAAGYEAHAINYPSTRRSLSEHADQIERILERAEGVREVSFVTHSMGGIVSRVVLARQSSWRKRIKVNRLVMIATPNRGAGIAQLLHPLPVFRDVAGPSLAQLDPDDADAIPVPDVKFGVIAGGRGDGRGYNPLLDGDDDMTVSVAETRLDEAEDHLIINAMHTFIMVHPDSIRATLRYLKHGRFRA